MNEKHKLLPTSHGGYCDMCGQRVGASQVDDVFQRIKKEAKLRSRYLADSSTCQYDAVTLEDLADILNKLNGGEMDPKLEQKIKDIEFQLQTLHELVDDLYKLTDYWKKSGVLPITPPEAEAKK